MHVEHVKERHRLFEKEQGNHPGTGGCTSKIHHLGLLYRPEEKCSWAKSKISHHCDGRNFFFQLSFLSSQKARHFMYITWVNNHCTPQKHQRHSHDQQVTIGTHLKVRQTEFCAKIPSVAKTHFRLSCFSCCVFYTESVTTQQRNQHTSLRKGKN